MSGVDLPLSEAIQELTGVEVIGIEKRYGRALEDLGGIRTLCGAVWAYMNRETKTEWSTVERLTMRELAGFFAAEDPDPDSDQGKGSTISAEPQPGSPTSA